jgi:hypothetical protein
VYIMPQQGPGRRLRRQVAKAKALEQLEAQEREQGLLVNHTAEFELIGRSRDIHLILQSIGWNGGVPHDVKQRLMKKISDLSRGAMDPKTVIALTKVQLDIEKNLTRKAQLLLMAEKSGLGPQVKESSADAPESTKMSGDEFFDKLLEAAKTVEQVNTLRDLVARIDS